MMTILVTLLIASVTVVAAISIWRRRPGETRWDAFLRVAAWPCRDSRWWFRFCAAFVGGIVIYNAAHLMATATFLVVLGMVH